MSIILRVLDDPDPFEIFTCFFIDFPNDNTMELEQQHLCLSYHMKDNLLKYKNTPNTIKNYKHQNKSLLCDLDKDIRNCINEDYRTEFTIPVKHFVMDFT